MYTRQEAKEINKERRARQANSEVHAYLERVKTCF